MVEKKTVIDVFFSPEEAEQRFGERIRQLRLQKNEGQNGTCQAAGISLTALKNLEAGRGSTLRTMIAVLRALGRDGWLATISPEVTINPLHIVPHKAKRQRASRRKPDGPI